MELTDLEICKKIAEIKGLMPTVVNESVITNRGLLDFFDLSPTHTANKTSNYFITLMFEFKVSVCHYRSFVYIESDYTDRPHKSSHSFDDGSIASFKKAVLLCIIEAHKE